MRQQQENTTKRNKITMTYVVALSIAGLILALILIKFVLPQSETFDGDAVKQRPPLSDFITQVQAEACPNETSQTPSQDCLNALSERAKDEGYDQSEIVNYLKQRFPAIP
ncbi:hypothetical protein IQ22_00609 [Pseudomonas duriflava]|uniref:Uncharacterized protein n=1 Tax=Pseudomonas duriflava TaxID=459528 RepID=A0A562QL42_9PSED|nr:hypothetical protein [Pseudomonas duriflava]TWI57393.1 hypothetical protein IQ22_00609 [Pseudomonas duriflava]